MVPDDNCWNCMVLHVALYVHYASCLYWHVHVFHVHVLMYQGLHESSGRLPLYLLVLAQNSILIISSLVPKSHSQSFNVACFE